MSRGSFDIAAADKDGTTALHWAVLWNDAETTNALLRAKAKVNVATDQGVTPLSLAALNANVGLLDTLLKAGADPNIATGQGETVLMTAARVGSLDIVRRLVDLKADVNAATANGQTALMWAAAEGHAPVVQFLLDHGANVNARSTGGFTPILFAAQKGHIPVAKLLLTAGADVNDTGPEGPTRGMSGAAPADPKGRLSALQIAIDGQHEDMANFLLDRGADPNFKGQGRYAIHSATQYAMPNLVKALLAKGAKVDVRMERPLPSIGFIIYIQNGLEVSYVGATPFIMAASYGDVEIMKILLAAGADPKAKTNDNSTALMVAAGIDFVDGQDKYGHHWFQATTEPLQARQLAAMKLCVENGVDVNAVNNKGQTALHGAVYYGGTQMVGYLIDHGAKLNIINKRGQTPWLIASQGEYRSGGYYSFPETAALLQKAGADTKIGKDLGPFFPGSTGSRN